MTEFNKTDIGIDSAPCGDIFFASVFSSICSALGRINAAVAAAESATARANEAADCLRTLKEDTAYAAARAGMAAGAANSAAAAARSAAADATDAANEVCRSLDTLRNAAV